MAWPGRLPAIPWAGWHPALKNEKYYDVNKQVQVQGAGCRGMDGKINWNVWFIKGSLNP